MQGSKIAESSGSAWSTAARRIAVRAARVADRIPLALALAVLGGAVLRILLEASYQPAGLSFADSAAYIHMADDAMFSDPSRTVGYPIFLELAHTLSADLERTIEIQHVLGIATGVLLYATVRRVGAPVWAAVVAAAAVLFSLDQIQLEHTVASESPFALVYTASLYSAVRGLEPGRALRGSVTSQDLWLVGAGLLLGVGIWIRGVAIALIPFLVLWVVVASGGSWPRRVVRGVVAGLPAVGLVLLYLVLNNAASGTFGLIKADGWLVYARTAQFANCSEFTPPEAAERLCIEVPPDERPAPFFFLQSPESPAQQVFGPPPNGDAEVGDFGWGALTGQPFDYARTVGNDFLRYFFPDLNPTRPFTDAGNELEIDFTAAAVEEQLRTAGIPDYYDPVGRVVVTGLGGALADLQQLLRIHPALLLQAALLGGVGLWFTRGRTRAAIVLLGGSALLVLAASATATYAPRYAVPISGPLVAAGVLGLWGLLQRYARADAGEPGRVEA